VAIELIHSSRCGLLLASALAAAVLVSSGARVARADDNEQRAREAFKTGDDHYAAGRYEESVKHFKLAYDLSKLPALLFNIANAYERMGEYEKAAEYLRQYLDSPKAENVASVRERIRRLELSAEARKRDQPSDAAGGEGGSQPASDQESASTAGPADVTSGSPDATLQRDGAGRSRKSKALPYTLLAVGAVGIAGGIGFGIVSKRAGDDADELCNDDNLCPRAAEAKLDRQRRFALASDISLGVGVAAVGAGVLLLLLRDDDKEPERSALRVTPSVGTAGFGVDLTSRF
jgi:tetratricopeptide (TPR) repeat protein